MLLFLSGVWMQILEGFLVGPGMWGHLCPWMLKEGEKVTVTPRLWPFGGFTAGGLTLSVALALRAFASVNWMKLEIF